jgi:DNA-binding IclR family transcriptional regulator
MVGADSATLSMDLESRILTLLAQHGPLDMAALIREAQAPLSSLLRSLHRLREFGLISTDGDAGTERFSLSPSGARTADSLATT